MRRQAHYERSDNLRMIDQISAANGAFCADDLQRKFEAQRAAYEREQNAEHFAERAQYLQSRALRNIANFAYYVRYCR